MKLADIADMTEYLANRCYCPGEIYDTSGFFFQIFSADEECKLIIDGSYKGSRVIAVVCRDQLISFWIKDDGTIESAERYDATENNIDQIKAALSGVKYTVVLDEFKPGETAKNLESIMSYADAIILD